VEVGTSDYDTLAQECFGGIGARAGTSWPYYGLSDPPLGIPHRNSGLSVDIIEPLLSNLPCHENLTKVCAAVTGRDIPVELVDEARRWEERESLKCSAPSSTASTSSLPAQDDEMWTGHAAARDAEERGSPFFEWPPPPPRVDRKGGYPYEGLSLDKALAAHFGNAAPTRATLCYHCPYAPFYRSPCPYHGATGCETCLWVGERCKATASVGEVNVYLAKLLHQKGLLDLYERREVATTTLPALLREHRILAVDILKIDAEGADMRILWETLQEHWLALGPISLPQMIVYEHIDHRWAESEALNHRLAISCGYEVLHGLRDWAWADIAPGGYVHNVVLGLNRQTAQARRDMLRVVSASLRR